MKTILGAGKFLRLVRNGKWEFVERANATGVVAIIAVTIDRRLVLTEQFRPAVGRRAIDLPAGLAGDIAGSESEVFAESAVRELMEETGFEAKQMDFVADCPSSPGLTSEIVSVFVATDLRQVNQGGGIAGEDIQVHLPSLDKIDNWLAQQISEEKLIDGKVYTGLYFASRKLTPC